MKSRLLKIWHGSEKRVGSAPRGSPWDRWGRLLALRSDAIRRRGWLGRPGGNESTQHGRKCVPIICRFVSLSGGVGLLYIINDDSLRNYTAGTSLASSSPSLALELAQAREQLIQNLPSLCLSHHFLRCEATVVSPPPHPAFFFLIFLFFINPSAPHCWETDRDDCEGHQRRAVSHGGAFTPLHVSWPFSWGSWKLLCPASVNTGRLCSSTSDPHGRCGVEEKRFFCVRMRVSVCVSAS